MFRKNALKFLILSLCVALVLPFVAVSGSVAKAVTNVIAPRSVDFVYKVENETIKSAEASKVTVKVDGVEVYKEGALVADDTSVTTDDVKKNIITMSYSSGKLTSAFGANGDYVVELSTTGESTTVTETFNLKVTTNKNELPSLTYKTDATSLDAYEKEVEKAAKNDAGESLKIGDTFTVPSFENVLNLGNYNYDSFNKTIYYASSGSTYYSSATASFDISVVGVYKFYAVFSTDNLIEGDVDSGLSIEVAYLVEKEDGFYKVLSSGNQVYAYKQADGSYKYYTDKDGENEITDETVISAFTTELTIPTFTFTISGSIPTVKSKSTYQEKGYIDYEYSGVSFTAKGNDIITTYTLEYSSNGTDGWAEAEETLSANLAFTPSKKGFYRVTAKVIDCEGNVATASTANIEVADKFVTVEFKTSFSDWLSVNTVPFIFLCISAASLIGLILVIVIKPKDKEVVKAEESDK